jgi:hypothetical protein
MIANFLYEYHDAFYVIQFIADIILFCGIVYAMLSHKLPKYHEKPLYFVGFFALLSALTIFATWVQGPLAEMSYAKIGIIPDTGVNVCLAFVAVQVLWNKLNNFSEKKMIMRPKTVLAKRATTIKMTAKKRRK